MGPVVHRPVDRHLDEGALRPHVRPVRDASADRHGEPGTGRSRRPSATVVDEPGRLTSPSVDGPSDQYGAREPGGARRSPPDRFDDGSRISRCLVRGEPREVLVEPAVAGQLVTAGQDRLGVVGERRQRVARDEQRRRDRRAGEQGEDPLDADARCRTPRG